MHTTHMQLLHDNYYVDAYLEGTQIEGKINLQH